MHNVARSDTDYFSIRYQNYTPEWKVKSEDAHPWHTALNSLHTIHATHP